MVAKVRTDVLIGARLTPNGNSYTEEWFVPAECTLFTKRDYDCVCVNQR